MARLVVPKQKTGQLASQSLADQPHDDYSERLVKYIPAESVVFYICVDRIISSAFGLDLAVNSASLPPDISMHILSYFFFGVALIGTPIYLRKRRLPGQPWIFHAVLSTIAFVGWAYSLGGSVFLIHGLHSFLIAGLVAPIFTFVAGWFEPQQTSHT